MKYKLRDNYSTDSSLALQSVLLGRGVEDIYNFTHPSAECELNPYDLENIEIAARKLLEHINKNSKILFVIDSD